MRELIIEKIIALNKKHMKMIGLTGLEDMQRCMLKNLDDSVLSMSFEMIIRYDEELKVRELFTNTLS
jgi:hypothetical protein